MAFAETSAGPAATAETPPAIRHGKPPGEFTRTNRTVYGYVWRVAFGWSGRSLPGALL